MSKSAQHQTMPKLEEWKAPWETKEVDGSPVDVPDEEQVIDKTKLKKYLYDVLSDKVKFRNQATDATAQAEELQQKLNDAKTPEDLKKVQEENARLIAERDDARKKAEGSVDALKWEVALDKGLSKTQAKRLVGKTREELEADADELLASWGHQGESGGGEGDEVRRGPRRRVNNSGDPDPDAGNSGKDEPDPEKVVAEYFKNRR